MASCSIYIQFNPYKPGPGPGFLERGFICIKVCVGGGGSFSGLISFFLNIS